VYWDYEITPEEEEEMIRKIAERIHKYGMEVATILMVESLKPLTFVGTQMGRFFINPFLPAFGDEIGMTGEKFFQVFEKRENVDRLLETLEELASGEGKSPSEETEISTEDESMVVESEEVPPKRGWRRFLPF
jgi:hypothetical protein